MKSVLYIVDGLGYGGSQRYVVELARFASKFNVNPHVCSFEKGDEIRGELLEANIPTLVTPIKKLYTKQAIKALRAIVRYIKENRIEIIHTFQTNANILGTIAGTLSNVPVIASRRDIGDYGMRGSWRLALFEKVVINKLTKKIMANSVAAIEATEKYENVPRKKLALIYNGIDFNRFKPRDSECEYRKRLGLAEDVVIFGIVASLRAIKSIDTLVKAFHRVHAYNSKTFLIIVGDGPERKNLESLINSLGIIDKVKFFGARSDISEILPAMNVFVLCSKSESFSNAILESMSAGLPVIATNVGGNPESVVNNVTGFLVPPQDPIALSEAMIDLLDDPVKRVHMGEQGILRIKNLFSLEKSHQELKKLYNSID